MHTNLSRFETHLTGKRKGSRAHADVENNGLFACAHQKSQWVASCHRPDEIGTLRGSVERRFRGSQLVKWQFDVEEGNRWGHLAVHCY